MHSTKIKTLLIYRYLLKYSDEDNPISSAELIELLKKTALFASEKAFTPM